MLFGEVAHSQQVIRFDNLVAMSNQEVHKHDFSAYFKECSNEPQVIMTGLFVGYKSLFSSQDQKSCTFTPSCSEYAILTIRKKGILEGFLDAIDRLTRCNGLSPENYETDTELNLLIDTP
jgi:hypothetical protein